MKGLLLVVLLFVCSYSFAQSRVQAILNPYKDSLSNYGIVALVDNRDELSTGSIGWSHAGSPMQANTTQTILPLMS